MLKKTNKKIDEIVEKVNSILEKPILTSFIILIFLAILVIGLSFSYYREDFDNFYAQVLAEAHGMLFDLAIIGILIFWLNNNGEMRQRVRAYKDEIDDFRLWASEEAAFKIVGNIKRLNRHKVFSINLVNAYLAKTNLNYVILRGSNLNTANLSATNLMESDLSGARLNQTIFEGSTLNQSNLTQAYASGANFVGAYLIKVNLEGAFLIKTNFTDAFLMEANLRGCYMTGTNLTNANLYKADLRGATGLTIKQLASSKTLYLAQFDDEMIEKIKKTDPSLLEK